MDSVELGVGLVRVSRKGSPSFPGSSKVNVTCGSMELRCLWRFLIGSFLVALWKSSTYLNHHLINVRDEGMVKDSKCST